MIFRLPAAGFLPYARGQPHPAFQLPSRFKMLKSLANSDHRLKLPQTAVKLLSNCLKLLVSKLKS